MRLVIVLRHGPVNRACRQGFPVGVKDLRSASQGGRQGRGEQVHPGSARSSSQQRTEVLKPEMMRMPQTRTKELR